MAEHPRLTGLLARLLPARVRDEVFTPALHDLTIERAAGRRGPSRLALVLLFLDCARVSLLTLPERIPVFLTDLRHAFRRLLREPAFTAAAVLTLALAIGLNVAVFSVFEAVVLRPLPYPQADRLVVLDHRDRETGVTKQFIAIGDYVDIEHRRQSLSQIATFGDLQITVWDAEPYRVSGLLAGPGLMEILGIQPELGRSLVPLDFRLGTPNVLLMSHRLWEERYGSDPGMIGRSLTIGGAAYEVVGIIPSGVAFPPGHAVELVLPSNVPDVAPEQRKSGWVFAVARLAPGQTARTATDDLERISAQLEVEHPEQNTGSTYYAVPLRDQVVGDTKQALILLLAAVGFVMLIACANVANLQLARSLARRRDVAVRLALGSGWGRVAGELLAESAALTLMAGTAGIALAAWGSRALVALVPASVRAPGLEDVRVGGPVLGFALALALLAALVFGLMAAIGARGQNAGDTLAGAGRASAGRQARRATRALVTAEIALALVLVLGAGLVVRSFDALLAVDPGFRAQGVITLGVQLPAERYQAVDARAAFHRDFQAAVRAIPGVQAIGSAVVIPLTGNNWTAPFERLDEPVPPGERPPDVGWQLASGGYFEAMGIPLLSGRLFDERDGPDGPPTVIVSRAIEERFFPGGSAVGRHITGDGPEGFEIVGVVGDIRRAGLTDQPRLDLYMPEERVAPRQITFFVRTGASDPLTVVPAIRAALRQAEPGALLLETRTMEDVTRASVGVTNLLRWLLGVFSACALVLAAVGIYGVMSYAVRQRTREIGTRMAVGATRGAILRLVLRDGAKVAAVGVVIGLVVGLASTRALHSVLFGVTATDPATLVGATLLLAGTALVACWIPARRAASTDAARTLSQP